MRGSVNCTQVKNNFKINFVPLKNNREKLNETNINLQQEVTFLQIYKKDICMCHYYNFPIRFYIVK